VPAGGVATAGAPSAAATHEERVPGIQFDPLGTLLLAFTCKKCETRTARMIGKVIAHAHVQWE
jgi:hypothetical protein